MRTLIHISDLHFGREDARIAEALLNDIAGQRPDVVAISGDFTQRARRRQFRAAREWLRRLPVPTVSVPGNHDIPLYDLARRALRPLDRFRRYITAEDMPLFHDEEIAVLGINTARSLAWKEGRISLDQIRAIRDRLCEVPDRVFKVLVTHHPFIPPPPEVAMGGRAPKLVGRVDLALRSIESCGIELLLAGHLHLGYSGDVAGHHIEVERSILVAQAGTAMSDRRRGEPNGYNLIRIDPPHLELTVRAWQGTGFDVSKTTDYVKVAGRWILSG